MKTKLPRFINHPAPESSARGRGLRWGFLGAARISRDNWQAIQGTGDSQVVAVGSRDEQRGQNFVAECQQKAPMRELPRVHGSYDAVLTDRDVDAVYVPLPTALRKEWVIRAAEAGKHVLCEKPCAVSFSDLAEMVSACRRYRVQFMDGVMFLHNRRQALLETVLGDPVQFGEVRRISAAFGYCATPGFFARDIRGDPKLEPHGALGDAGWYPIRLSLWVMREQLPSEVTGRILRRVLRPGAGESYIAEFSGELFFEGGASASYFCSFLSAPHQWAQIIGTKGCIELPDFLHAVPNSNNEFTFLVRRGLREPPTVQRCTVVEDKPSLAPAINLFRDFAEHVATGALNEEWPRLSLRTQLVMDACYESALQDGRAVKIDTTGLAGF